MSLDTNISKEMKNFKNFFISNEIFFLAVEGESPGGMFELNLEDRYYLGGVPGDVPIYK